MPELPEVERAKNLVKSIAQGKTIVRVDTVEDSIVYSGITHTDFAKEVTGRKVKDAVRYGKLFYLELDGKGRMPVFHFGMSGMVQVKGQQALHYRATPKDVPSEWPPKYMKFVFHIQGDLEDDVIQLAYMDTRRLGRVRLCTSPPDEHPISSLGFDPILCMPSLSDFRALVLKRTCPIKALLLDQSFSAGVGNWVADEILYRCRIHPERRCNALVDLEVEELHRHVQGVCKAAVALNADYTKFPDDWLFKYRWEKGRKQKQTMILPSGEPATIKWVTVGGRSSAYVVELQKLTMANSTHTAVLPEADSESDLTPLEDEEMPQEVTTKKRVRKVQVTETVSKIRRTSRRKG